MPAFFGARADLMRSAAMPPVGGPAMGQMTRATISSINADGWSAQDSAPTAFDPVAAPQYIVLNRQGFDNTGAPKTYTDNLIITTRVRQPYPNQAQPDANKVALTDYVYSSDTIAGGGSPSNGSALASPQPIAQFVGGRERSVVGDVIPKEFFELTAFHRNARKGKQVACVIWTITDKNGLSVSVSASGTVISGNPLDKVPVPVYRPAANVNVASLAEGLLTINAKVYPWIGTAASVADSSALAVDAFGFAPIAILRSVSLAANPPIAYVQAGAAGSPQVSTNDATAYANPFPDIGSACVALRSFTSNNLAGCRIRLMAGTQTIGSTGGLSYTSVVGECVVECDPRTTVDQVTLSITANSTIPADFLRLKYITYLFSGFFYLSPNGSAPIAIEGCISRAPNAQITQRPLRIMGLTNGSGGVSSSAPLNYLIRGVAGAYTAGTTINAVVGNALAPAILGQGANDNRGLIAFNVITKMTSTMLGLDTNDISGFAFVQNVVEFTGSSATYSLGISSDGKTNNITHFVCHNNTLAGAFSAGRNNTLYDEMTGAAVRTHKLQSFRGNIHVQVNCKSDIFDGANNGDANAALHIGNWAYRYGVGSSGEVVCWPDAGAVQNGTGGSFSQDFSGLNYINAANVNTPIVPKFVNPQCTTFNAGNSTYTAGAGNGNYALQSGSPCASLLADPVLEWDLAGNPRKAANDSSGAYVGAA